MHPHRHAAAGLQVEHVALAQQGLGAHLVENGSGIDLGRDLEGDARGNVGLDQAGDDIDRRALGGQDQVDAGGARLLGQTGDQLLDFFADHHHQIGQLVDDNHDLRQPAQRLGRVGGQRERVGDQGFALLGVGDLGVVARQVAHPELAQQTIAPLHFGHTPVQRVAGVLHVGDHRRQQVRDAFVRAHLQHLGVDEDHAHLRRIALVEQRQQHGVDAHRLARARRAGHQQVGHAGQVGADGMAGDVLAQRQRDRRSAVGIHLRAEDLGQAHRLTARIGQLQPHQVLARDGLDHPQRHQRQRARQVLGQIDDLAALHPGRGLDLVPGDDRARISGHHVRGDVEIGQLLFDQARGVLERLGRHRLERHWRGVEQRQRRQLRVGRKVDEQRRLHLGGGPHRGLDAHGRSLDAHRLGIVVDDAAQFFDLLFALDHRDLADAPVLAGSDRQARPLPGELQAGADHLHQGQPGNPDPQAQAGGHHREQHQCAADRADMGEQRVADQQAEQPAGRQRQ